MMRETTDILAVTAFTNVTETNLHHISPIISFYMLRIIGYINGYVLTMIAGVFGIFTNTANISVYLKMGLSETTNISFFSLSISDLLVSMSAVVVQLTYNPPVSVMKLPSGASVSEIGMGASYIMFPCMGCSAWITAILCIERCLCVAVPLKVRKDFFFQIYHGIIFIVMLFGRLLILVVIVFLVEFFLTKTINPYIKILHYSSMYFFDDAFCRKTFVMYEAFETKSHCKKYYLMLSNFRYLSSV